MISLPQNQPSSGVVQDFASFRTKRLKDELQREIGAKNLKGHFEEGNGETFVKITNGEEQEVLGWVTISPEGRIHILSAVKGKDNKEILVNGATGAIAGLMRTHKEANQETATSAKAKGGYSFTRTQEFKSNKQYCDAVYGNGSSNIR